jgi:hypothetical protein
MSFILKCSRNLVFVLTAIAFKTMVRGCNLLNEFNDNFLFGKCCVTQQAKQKHGWRHSALT